MAQPSPARLAAALTLVSVFTLAACKVRIEVPAGGSVTTASGVYSCPELGTCDIDVVDVYFDETFIATPRNGMKFDGWRKRDRGIFGGSLDNARIVTSGFAGNALFEQILASDEVFYLTPSFSAVQCTENCGVATSTWTITENVNAVGCGEGTYSESYSLTIRQEGDAITVTAPAGVFTGTLSGTSLSWSGSYPEDGGTASTSLTATFTENSLSGSSNWSWTGGGFSCSGTTQFSGTRTSGTVPGAGGSVPGDGGSVPGGGGSVPGAGVGVLTLDPGPFSAMVTTIPPERVYITDPNYAEVSSWIFYVGSTEVGRINDYACSGRVNDTCYAGRLRYSNSNWSSVNQTLSWGDQVAVSAKGVKIDGTTVSQTDVDYFWAYLPAYIEYTVEGEETIRVDADATLTAERFSVFGDYYGTVGGSSVGNNEYGISIGLNDAFEPFKTTQMGCPYYDSTGSDAGIIIVTIGGVDYKSTETAPADCQGSITAGSPEPYSNGDLNYIEFSANVGRTENGARVTKSVTGRSYFQILK